MKERGFTLTVILILAAAMFSTNLVTDNSNDLSGMQSRGEEPDCKEETIKVSRDNPDPPPPRTFVDKDVIICEGNLDGWEQGSNKEKHRYCYTTALIEMSKACKVYCKEQGKDGGKVNTKNCKATTTGAGEACYYRATCSPLGEGGCLCLTIDTENPFPK